MELNTLPAAISNTIMTAVRATVMLKIIIRVTERDVLESIATQILRGAEVLAREHEAPEIETILEFGDPAATILSVANGQNADAIVMGSRGLGDLSGMLMGSVSHKVAHLCKCTCITVK